MVRVMTFRMVGALVASLGFVALAGSANEAAARSGAPAVAGAAGARPVAAHAPIGRPFRHHHGRSGFGGFWPTAGGYYDGASYGGAPVIDVTQPSNVHYTYTYDVPWDWAHRYPPAVVPSDRPYAPSCTTEVVTVPGRGGDRTVNVTRCY
jgi:hypothetical protein